MIQQNYKKTGYIVIFALVALLISFFTIPVGATTAKDVAKLKSDLFTITQSSNMAVTIYYDTEEPTVYFQSPDGKDVFIENLTVQRDEKVVAYFIPNAMAGKWVMYYDKGTNSELDVNWAPYANPITIKSFVASAPDSSDKSNVSFEVSSSVAGAYNYKVYAAILDGQSNVTGKTELTSSTGEVNTLVELSLDVSKLQTYDKYYFYLDVWREEDGIESNDTAVTAEPFSVANLNSPKAIENAKIQVDLTGGILDVNWTEYKKNCDEYILAVYDTADNLNPIFSSSYKSDVTETSLNFGDDVKELRLELSYFQSGNTSKMLKKTIPIEPAAGIFTTPETELVSSKQVSIPYSTYIDFLLDVTVNDVVQQITISGNGSFAIELDDFDNFIRFSYSLEDDHIAYVLEKTISVDAIAPMLLLPENDKILYVKEKTFDLVGSTETDCTLTINGETVRLNKDGTFLKTLKLSDGANEFTINATDMAGNVSTQIVVITKVKSDAAIGSAGTPFNRKYFPMICGFGGSVFLVICIFILSKLFDKDKKVSTKFALASFIRNVFAVLLVLSVGFMGISIWKYFSLKSVVKSEKLFDETMKSVSSTYNKLKQFELMGKLIKVSIIIFVIILALFVLTMFLARKIKRNKQGLNKNKEKKDKSKADVKAVMPNVQTDEAGVIGETTTDVVKQVQNVKEPITKLTEETLMGNKEEYKCLNCGAKYDKQVKFCKACGNKM
ncbi:MAG: zinc ribbon domain-containing protein [Clostridiales bacterium]|nr:zinc ribbon domain-containing protein [Clostridiales bacterium]